MKRTINMTEANPALAKLSMVSGVADKLMGLTSVKRSAVATHAIQELKREVHGALTELIGSISMGGGRR